MINYDIVVKLRNALAIVYWYKDDMINIIHSHPSEWIGYDRKNNYSKSELAHQVLQRLWDEKKYDEINQLVNQVLQIENFSHFDKIENGSIYKDRAINAVLTLKTIVEKE